MEFFKIATQLQEESIFPAVLATLVRVEGSSYRRAGARLLWGANGATYGSISGGCLETDLSIRAKSMVKSKSAHEYVSYDTSTENDLIWGVGTGCHGTVHILLEAFYSRPVWLDSMLEAERQRRVLTVSTRWRNDEGAAGQSLGTRIVDSGLAAPMSDSSTFVQNLWPSWNLVLFGAGDDAKPLVEMAKIIHWEVTVVDPRPAVATAERFPLADRVMCLSPEESSTALSWDERTVAVIMTHHYVHDLPLLRMLLPMRLPFLGLLGPKERGQRLLKDAGADPANAALLHSPVGLDLGGDGPGAVALAILSEIHAKLNQRDARPLRDRVRPIHANA